MFSNIESRLEKLQRAIKNAFLKIKEEFDEHLHAINENTNEIQSNYEYLCRLETRIDKIEEKINEMGFIVDQFKAKKTYSFQKVDGSQQQFQVSPLTQAEMQVFLVLYTIDDLMKKATYHEIAKKLTISESLVQNYITNLIEKGIPIIKQYLNNKVYLKLDADFKNLQAKKNILNIDQSLAGNIV